MNIDTTSLYRIGTGWVFDISTYTGYRVEREGRSGRGKVKSFTEAFKLKTVNSTVDIEYVIDSPIGVIRKAIHIVELHSEGKLEERSGKYH